MLYLCTDSMQVNTSSGTRQGCTYVMPKFNADYVYVIVSGGHSQTCNLIQMSKSQSMLETLLANRMSNARSDMESDWTESSVWAFKLLPRDCRP